MKKPRPQKDRRTEEEKREAYIRDRAAIRGISVEEYKAELERALESCERFIDKCTDRVASYSPTMNFGTKTASARSAEHR